MPWLSLNVHPFCLEAQMDKSHDEHPVLVMVNVPPEAWAYPLGEERQVIGRGPAARIVIPSEHGSVSRRHAEVWTDRMGAWIQDLDSRSGTRVNRVDLGKMVPTCLKNHDRIWMGGVELKLLPEMPARGTFCPELANEPGRNGLADDASTIGRDPSTPVLNTAELLSPAEHEVLLCMARGFLQDDEIARELHRSPSTVRTHVGNIVKKLEIRSRNDILFWLQAKNKPAN